jgi:hypothetical protein
MQWLIIIIALVLAIPTYGISLIVLLFIMPYLSAKTRQDIFPGIIRKALIFGRPVADNNVYFEAAERYAEDTNNVANQEKGTSIDFYELIDGEKVSVSFSRSAAGRLIVIAKYY